MRRTRVKICGIMRPEDVAMAADCGADAVGMIFHASSPRNVSVATAREILAELPPFVTPVALFVDPGVRDVLDIVEALGVRHIQLHGNETPSLVAALTNLIVIKAIRADDKLVQSLALFRSALNLHGIVLETAATAHPGGTGIPNNWNLIRSAKEAGAFLEMPPIIAAGGLNPENVGEVIRSLRPWAVDVSSGVESTRGQKSETLVKQFIAAVERADRADDQTAF